MERKSDFGQWDDLSPDVLALVFRSLEFRELLQVIPVVCKSWCKVVEGSYCWQTINTYCWIQYDSLMKSPEKIDRMLRTLITRSSGSLRKLIVYPGHVVTDQLFSFIADHAGSLQTLIINTSPVTDSTVERFASKFASVTMLDISEYDQVGTKALEGIGRNCKNLVSLSFKKCKCYTRSYTPSDAEVACTIGRTTMPNLKYLTVAFRNLKTQDVLEILSGFPELEFLNISCCWISCLDEKLLEEKYPKVQVTICDSACPPLFCSIDWSDYYGFSIQSDDDGSSSQTTMSMTRTMLASE